MSDCIFCKIIRKEIPADILVESDYAILIRDRNPLAKEHILAIPKAHAVTLSESFKAEHQPFPFFWTVKLATEWADKHMENGYRIVANTGRDAGQAVAHLHWHVMGGERLPDMPKALPPEPDHTCRYAVTPECVGCRERVRRYIAANGP